MRLRRPHLSVAPRSDDGFGLVEVLVAVLILTVALLGLIGAFTSARKLTLLSERRTSAAHRAQLEVERLQATPYSELLMTATPTHSAESTNPNYYVNLQQPGQMLDDLVLCLGREQNHRRRVARTRGSGSRMHVEGITTECGVVAISPTGRGLHGKTRRVRMDRRQRQRQGLRLRDLAQRPGSAKKKKPAKNYARRRELQAHHGGQSRPPCRGGRTPAVRVSTLGSADPAS